MTSYTFVIDQRKCIGCHACVVVCPEHAIIAGDLHNPNTAIVRLIAREPVRTRKPSPGHSNTAFKHQNSLAHRYKCYKRYKCYIGDIGDKSNTSKASKVYQDWLVMTHPHLLFSRLVWEPLELY